MRKIFNLLFLAPAVCLVCVPGHAERAEKHEGKAAPFARPSSNSSLKKADGTVVTWTRVKPEELITKGVKDVDACVGEKNKDGAWAEPDYKNENGTLVKGKIWCGAIPPKTMSYGDAKSYCKDKGMELGSGYPEDQNGKNNFPNEDSDWVRFRKNSGAESVKGFVTPKGYTSEVLPNMNAFFWSSSSVHLDYSEGAYVFLGRNGVIVNATRYYANRASVRCVVSRR